MIYYNPNTEFPICKSYENKQQKQQEINQQRIKQQQQTIKQKQQQKQQQKIIKKQKFNNMIRRDKITSILTSPKNGEDDTLLFSVSGIYYIIIWTILLCNVKSSPLMVIYTILSILVCWFIVTEHLRVFAYFIDFTLITLWVLLWGGPCIVTWMVGVEIVRICILECD